MLPMLGALGGGGGMSLDMGSEAKSEGFSSAENVFATGSFSLRGDAGGGMNEWMPVILVVAALVAIGFVGRTFK